MRVRDVQFPDGSMLIAGSDAEFANYSECLRALGDMVGEDDLIKDRETDAVACLSKYYPGVPGERLTQWLRTAELYSPESLAPFIAIARRIGISREAAVG